MGFSESRVQRSVAWDGTPFGHYRDAEKAREIWRDYSVELAEKGLFVEASSVLVACANSSDLDVGLHLLLANRMHNYGQTREKCLENESHEQTGGLKRALEGKRV